jgi:hypothetical protein
VPLSSLEIAQINSSYTSQYAQQAQLASSVGGYRPFGAPRDPNQIGEGLAGRAMNRGMAYGGPLAAGAMALTGLDPVSLGLRAGAASYGAGMGIGGGLAMGAGVAGGAMVGLAGVAYAGNQFMTGANQVQSFNQNMRGSYGFHNPGAFSGHGFGQQDMREIGGMVRSMSGGDQGFDELGRLAAQMGRMGMAQGVKNAKEFGEKFRDMLTSVKTIAKELGTTLEEAQTTMASMRGSGVFNRQGAMAAQIRQASVSGGLATTEVTGMMNIGSQISRMYGGTGRQGAVGGMEAINQIGTAVQRGVLSEEDIYNATGLTGAEGRRAMATQQLEQTGSFLKSGKGRWFLASLAGRNGKLDSNSISNWMSGGMDVEQTRNQAHSNLRGVGRANFIRNEGRLRGAVMEQFGGLAPAMAMSQWAQGKGIDINEMDDRSMLFAQRQLGMGRDEADSAIRMARQLPELMRSRRESQSDDTSLRERLERQSNVGVDGLKRRFERARNRVNNELQRAGQNVMNSLSDTMSEWANRLAGSYEEVGVQGLGEITHSLERGGGGAANVLRSGSQMGGAIRSLAARQKTSISNLPGVDRGRSEELKNLKFAAQMGDVGELGGALGSFVGSNKGMLMEKYSDELAGLSGEDRMQAMGKLLSYSPGGQGAAAEFAKLSRTQKATTMQQLERTIGVKEGARSDTMMGATQRGGLMDEINHIFSGRASGSGPRTEAGRLEEAGRGMLGMSGEGSVGGRVSRVLNGLGIGVTALSGGLLAPAGMALSGASGFLGHLAEETFGDSAKAKAGAGFLQSQSGREMVFGMLAGKGDARQRANQDIQELQARAGRGEKLSSDEQGWLEVMQRAKLAMDYQQAMSAGGGKLSDAAKRSLQEKLARIQGRDPKEVSFDQVEGAVGQIGSAAGAEFERLKKAEISELQQRGGEEARGLQAGGLAQMGKGGLELTRVTREQLMKSGGKGAVHLAELALAATQAEQGGDIEGFQRASGGFTGAMAGASVKELQAMARGMAGTTQGGMAAELLMQGRRMNAGIRQAGREGLRGGAAGTTAIARELGLNLDRDQLQGLGGLGSSEAAARLAKMTGVGDNKEFAEGIARAIDMARTGKGQGAAGLLGKTIADLPEEQRKKLQESTRGGPDPMEKLADKIGEGNRFLEALVKSNKQAAQALLDLNNKTPGKDGEGPPPPK